jgi:hypothetical protein
VAASVRAAARKTNIGVTMWIAEPTRAPSATSAAAAASAVAAPPLVLGLSASAITVMAARMTRKISMLSG